MVDLFYLFEFYFWIFFFWFDHFFRRFNIHLIPQLYSFTFFAPHFSLDSSYYGIGLSFWFFMHHVEWGIYETGVDGGYCKCSFYQKNNTTFCFLEPSK